LSKHLQESLKEIIESYSKCQVPSSCTNLKQRLDLGCKISANRDLDIGSLPRRINTQMTVLYNQIAQRDAHANTAIADATKDDGTSMKTMAVLTTVFLLGAYIAVSFPMVFRNQLSITI
jgi:hypothetical protein